MRQTLLKGFLTVSLLLPAALPAAAASRSHRSARAAAALDGTRWKMRFRSARAWLRVWKGDVIRFEAGKFHDYECGSYGFSEADYTVRPADGRSVWKATRYNSDGERVDWEGVVEGDTMSGTFIWSRPDGHSRTYSFKARRTAARAASKG